MSTAAPTFGARLAASVAGLFPKLRDAPGRMRSGHPKAQQESRMRSGHPKAAQEIHAFEGASPESKASAAGPLIAFEHLKRPVWTPRDYTAFANEGFRENAIVYRSVRMIAECVAYVPLLLYAGDQEIEQHPLKDLLGHPNPHQTWPEFMQALVGYLLVSGNAYLEAVAVESQVREIHLLRPDRVKVVPGSDGWPEAFDYTVGARTVRIGGEATEGVRRVLHVRLFHPTNDYYGLSPLEAAASAIDLHNTASKWNKALLDNSARPSGAIVYTARDGNLTSEQVERLKSELEAGFQGSGNAGRPLLLEGGLDWKAMSLSPKDMDFIEARHVAAREIALALGVPPMLLGIPGDNTYANLAEAQRTFWRQTVLPLVGRIARELSGWLAPAYPVSGAPPLSPSHEPLRLVADLDDLPALSSEREALWAALEKTSFLTTEEKRELAGFSPTPDSETNATTKFNPNHDALGRFTTADGAGDGIVRTPDGTTVEPVVKRPRGGGRPAQPGHNNPPGPMPPILPPAQERLEQRRLRDENGVQAPRGFASLEKLNAFKRRLAEELPPGVSAVMQGSSVERGGTRFRVTAQGGQAASDFDVSLTGGDIFDLAAARMPRMVKGDRVGPLSEERLKGTSKNELWPSRVKSR